MLTTRLGGFGAQPKYDTHILNTLYAVQILFMEDALDRIDVDKVASCEYASSSAFGELTFEKMWHLCS